MINYEKDIKGKLADVSDNVHEEIKEIAANFHIRNGVKQHDGSMGEMKITHEQFKQCLAYMFLIGVSDAN